MNKQTVSQKSKKELLTRTEWKIVKDELQLSPRELQIVQQIFLSNTKSVIATNLKISIHTVHSYFRRLYKKLGVADQKAVIISVFAVIKQLENEIEKDSVEKVTPDIEITTDKEVTKETLGMGARGKTNRRKK